MPDIYIHDVSPMEQCPHATMPLEEVAQLFDGNTYLFYCGDTSIETDFPNWAIDKTTLGDETFYYITTTFVSVHTAYTGMVDRYIEYSSSLETLLKRVPVTLSQFVLIDKNKAVETVKEQYRHLDTPEKRFDFKLYLNNSGTNIKLND